MNLFNLHSKPIAKDASTSYPYAKHILKEPFALGEPEIAKDGGWSYMYAKDVLNARFKLGEPAIAVSGAKTKYEKLFKVKLL